MKCVKRQKKKHQPKLIPLIKQKINRKKDISSWYMKFMDWSRKYVSVTLREEYSFQDQQRWCFFSLKFIYIQQNIFETLSTNFWTKIPAQKALEKTQHVSVTWPKLRQVSDQDQEGGSLTAMFFFHSDIYIWCF